jgi:ribosomal protein S27AE
MACPTVAVVHGPEYSIQHATGRYTAIVCRTCGMVSFNPHDVTELYCGRCHKFHKRHTQGDSDGGGDHRHHPDGDQDTG